MENIHVDTAKYGDRLDHIAALGRVKRRIEIMHNLPGNPFVIILNLQIPGDPPCSIVFYFLVPLSFYNGSSSTSSSSNSDGLDNTRELFKKFIDIPYSTVPTESEAFIQENSGILGMTVDDNITDSSNTDQKLIRSTTTITTTDNTTTNTNTTNGSTTTTATPIKRSWGRAATTTGINNNTTTSTNSGGSTGKTKSAFFAPPAAKSWTR